MPQDFLARIFPDKERADDANMPKAFFQVALDVPGYGDSVDSSASDSIHGFFNSKVLSEIIKSVSKAHAYCIVAYKEAAATLLQLMLTAPKLTSFIVLREPELDRIDIDSLHGIIHPCLSPFDPDGPPNITKAQRNLNVVLQQVWCSRQLSCSPHRAPPCRVAPRLHLASHPVLTPSQSAHTSSFR